MSTDSNNINNNSTTMTDQAQQQIVYKFDDISSSEGSYTSNEKVKRTKLCYGLLFLIVLAALATITAGVVLLRRTKEYQQQQNSSGINDNKIQSNVHFSQRIRNLDEYCAPSDEAQRIGLNKFLKKCQDLYYEIFPHEELLQMANSPQETLNKIAKKFKPFVPTPTNLKKFADQIAELQNELHAIQVDEDQMKPKENQILAEIKVFLSQHMSNDFESGFYGGGWMFGPNYFCFNRICTLQDEVRTLTYYFRPTTVEDIEMLMKTFLQYNVTFNQHIENLKLGIQTGMIKSKSSCDAGQRAFNEIYFDIINRRGFPLVSSNIRAADFYKGITESVHNEWYQKYGKTIIVSLYSALVHGFVKPVSKYYDFLSNEYIKKCPTDQVASGLANLPVRFEYTDGIPDFEKPTTMKLPLTDTPLSGKCLYNKILQRYTTLNVTAEIVNEEGQKQLANFYPKIVEIAKQFTKLKRKDDAIAKMRERLQSPDQFHGASKFPEIESNATAYARCVDDSSARKFCPTRWRSMEKWKNYMNRILAMIHPLLNDLFHFTGDRVSVPNCPITVRPHFNPSIGAMYYEPSDAECTTPTMFALPFFLEKYGPKFQEWSITGHEGRPGHNFQIQGAVELFSSPCKNNMHSFIHQKGYFSGFVEGWALYAENPVLSDDVNLYENNMLQKLGMYKWQIWRAVRLVIDTGLHYREGNSKEWALQQLETYALDSSDFGRKEVVRYMSAPGQAASYMMGRLEFIKARRRFEEELAEHFDIKDFHYQVLSLGPVPLGYLSKYIERYLRCLKEPERKFCEYLLTPVRSIPRGSYDYQQHAQPHQQQQQQQQQQHGMRSSKARYYL